MSTTFPPSMGDRPRLTVVTPCSRPENLATILPGLDACREAFDLCWLVMHDGPPPANDLPGWVIQESHQSLDGVSGYALLNLALDRIQDGWVWVLDDDNAVHPNFVPCLREMIKAHPDAKAFVFPQLIDGYKVRAAEPRLVRECSIDQAQFVLRRDFIGEDRYPLRYTGDGAFVERLHAREPAAFRFATTPAVFYNALRPSRSRKQRANPAAPLKLGIVMPVVLQNEALLTITLEAVAHLRTRHEATLYVVVNRLHVCSPEQLRQDLAQRFAGRMRLLYEPGVERSVAGAWNHGCGQAREEGADYVVFVANDTRLREDCLDVLVGYGEHSTTDLWSGLSYNNRGAIDPTQESDGADFTCFMLASEALERHGPFDTNFRPAYFEDNDYYARVVLGGGECRIVHAAQFYHHASATVNNDPEMAHHVRHWFGKNRDYFCRKWGVPAPENTREGVLARYHRHPFGDGTRALSWFPPEGA